MSSQEQRSTTILQDQEADTNNALHLRGSSTRRPRVRWEEGTIDNEHMDKKKSKSMYSFTCKFSLDGY